jgi:hypothetical protein
MKIQLIDNWRAAWKMWSVRLNLTGAGLTALLLALPDTLTTLWASLPTDFTALVPASALRVIPLLLFLSATVARFIKQKALPDA